MESDLKAELEKAQGRITYLEDCNRAVLDSLSRIESFGEFRGRVERTYDVNRISQAFLQEVELLLETQSCALSLVDWNTYEFTLKLVIPPHLVSLYEQELVEQIEGGVFPWAVNRRGATMVPSSVLGKVGWGRNLILVPLSTVNNTLGMLLVATDLSQSLIPQETFKLLSILAKEFSLAIENARIFAELEQARSDLEHKVWLRTRELEEAYEELKQLDQMKSDFICTVSHELRTPLTSIKAFAEILLDSPGEDRETQREFLSIIDEESERLTRLINNVLDLSKIESGRMEWHMEQVGLGEVIESSLPALRVKAEEKEIDIQVEVPPDLPTITGDWDRLIQVMTNLLDNAIKFTDQGGQIQVRVIVSDSEQMLVSVADTGRGIDPKDYHKIFDKFKQVADVLREKPRGTGLGLPICKQIVEHHGGRIWVESRLGQGSTFYFALPLTRVVAPQKTVVEKLSDGLINDEDTLGES